MSTKMCPACGGSTNCQNCSGKGQRAGKDCAKCKASGNCTRCSGKGVVPK